MTLFILFAALGPAPEMERPIFPMRYADLLKKSDLAIIAIFLSEEADDEPLDERLKGDEKMYEGITTKLQVLALIKGDPKREVAVRHHRVRSDFHGVIHSGSNFAEFKPKVDYLVFLKKRPDGRFQCVTGQVDPAFSVKRIEPRNWIDDRDRN